MNKRFKLSAIFPPLDEPKSREEAVILAEGWELAVKHMQDLCARSARNRALYWKELVLLVEWTIDKARIENKWLPFAEHLFFKMACDASLHGNEWGGDEDLMKILRVSWQNETRAILRELNIGVTVPPPPVPTEEHPEPAPKPEWA